MGWSKLSSNARGYGHDWQRLRLLVLKRDMYLCQCEVCRHIARVRVATEVDHIVPRARGGTDDLSNLQAINKDCHKLKTLIDNGYRPKVTIGADGWPIME